jgi:hypothetical protein
VATRTTIRSIYRPDETVDLYTRALGTGTGEASRRVASTRHSVSGPTRAEGLKPTGWPLVARAGLRVGIMDPGCVNGTWATTEVYPTRGWLGPCVNTVAEIREGFALNEENYSSGPASPSNEPTWLNHTVACHRAGRLPQGAEWSSCILVARRCYFARVKGTVSFGLPPTEAALAVYLEMLDGCDLPWSVSVVGATCCALPLLGEQWRRWAFEVSVLEDHAGARTPRTKTRRRGPTPRGKCRSLRRVAGRGGHAVAVAAPAAQLTAILTGTGEGAVTNNDGSQGARPIAFVTGSQPGHRARDSGRAAQRRA